VMKTYARPYTFAGREAVRSAFASTRNTFAQPRFA
jgi:hypothetical protein